MSGHQSCALLCRYRSPRCNPERCRQKLRAETAVSAMGIGTSQCSDRPGPGSAEFCAASQKSMKDAAAGRRTAREASMCPDSPRIHQQSHEGISRWCCAGLSGTGPQPASHGARVLELIPPARSVPRLPVSPGEEGDTDQAGAR